MLSGNRQKNLYIPELHNNDYSFFDVLREIKKPNLDKMLKRKEFTFIDLFAGIDGIIISFESKQDLGFNGKCIFTGKIKPRMIEVYKKIFC